MRKSKCAVEPDGCARSKAVACVRGPEY